MRSIFYLVSLLWITLSAVVNGQYIFTDETRVPCTPVKSQALTGTCWSFASTSFLESEIIRNMHKEINLSEMYNVRMAYLEKAQNYILRQGKANFGEGGLAHDELYNVKEHGLMPLEAYTGLGNRDDSLDHRELSAVLKATVDAVVSTQHPGRHWHDALIGILDAYMGPVPASFSYEGKTYDPMQFLHVVGINPDDYVSITSFTHHPFYTSFILEIPDNYMNKSFFNVPLDDITGIIDAALSKGYSVAWDGDVSEKGFSQKKGIAILPEGRFRDSMLVRHPAEMKVTQENRQENFMNYSTTDDHLMHLVGRAKDQDGNIYYIIKNSWGPMGPYKGYLYMSAAYLRMKTIAITVHKSALPKEVADKR